MVFSAIDRESASQEVLPDTRKTTEAFEAGGAPNTNPSLADLKDLLSRFNSTVSSAGPSALCPTLDLYRHTLGVGSLTTSDQAVHRRSFVDAINAQRVESRLSLSTTSQTYDDGNDDNDAEDYFIDDNDVAQTVEEEMGWMNTTPAKNASHRLSVLGALSPVRSDQPGGLFRDADTGVDVGDKHNHGVALVSDSVNEEGLPASMGLVQWEMMGLGTSSVTNDYAFFNKEDAQQQTNLWAGSKHWKFAQTKRKDNFPASSSAVNSGNLDEVDGDEQKQKRSSRKKALRVESNLFDFGNFEFADESLFAARNPLCKSKTDLTVHSAAMRTKANQKAAQGLLLLPSEDAHLDVVDLCRLFVRENVIVPPSVSYGATPIGSHWQHLLDRHHSRQASGRNASRDSEDVIWGRGVRLIRGADAGHPLTMARDNFSPDHDIDDGNEDDDYGCFDGIGQGSDAVGSVISTMEGLDINANRLLAASRTVEKIDVG